jgi:hypothetical protein
MTTTATIATIDGKLSRGGGFSKFYALLILFVSYDFHLVCIDDDDHTPSSTLTSTNPQVTQHIEMAMAAAAATAGPRDATRLRPLVSLFSLLFVIMLIMFISDKSTYELKDNGLG